MTATNFETLEETRQDQLIAARLKRRHERHCPELEDLALVYDGKALPEQIVAAAQHLQECSDCVAAVHLLRSMDAPAAPARAPTRIGQKWPWLNMQRLAFAATGLLLLFGTTWVALQSSSVNPIRSTLVSKGGGDSIAIAVRRGEERFVAQPTTPLFEGDLLGFFYSAVEPGYLLLLNVDEEGSSSRVFPVRGVVSGEIEAGQNVNLPDGGIMRAGPGCEWLVAVFSQQPLPIKSVEELVGSAAQDSGPECQWPMVAFTGARTVSVFRLQ
ncbi:MAG: hypothetical protein A2289_24720 [Deltaproteobacteria bacterium RIFOXYA12_FULL_58_15]|nr:MAG: hypothetical protein A2289_24720 [Deltaproteobacteria bacterium RIFOXYA12_FULL_58_15]